MLKRKNKENVSADAKKKPCLDTAGQSSSVDTENLDIPDTLTLARVDRENQGPWEAEYSYGGEADLHRHYNSCDKNPGHENFIPVDQFRKNDLPKGFRRKAIMDYIRAQSDLTVRVTVRYVSDRRPAIDPDSNKPYPGLDIRGQNKTTVGTGWVNRVCIYRNGEGATCQCKDCRNSPTPETHYAVIIIHTAKHVVFDDLEAEHTTCHLFFDSGGTPDTCSGVVTLTGMESIYSDNLKDECLMLHYTHDLDLGDRLRKTCTLKNDLMKTLYIRLLPITHLKPNLNVAEQQPLSFIVSHPHGCRKHISIGRWNSVSGDETRGYTYEYTTATCPGSSGAEVFLQDKFSPESERFILWLTPRIHSGTSEELPGVNYFIVLNDENNLRQNEERENHGYILGPGRQYPIL